MGHSEMLLAVAGLNKDEIQNRTGKLASGDWSGLAPEDQLACQFAYKMARSPWAVSDSDIKTLVDVYGQHRTLDLIWHCSWCNYMTRVADAFQLPLERENVFMLRKK